MSEQMSVVKAAQLFFSADPHGRKIEMAEFKALTTQDREDLREMLIAEGYNVAPLAPKP